MVEAGRLREIAFRDAGGGTGKPIDLDRYDTANPPFQQIIWAPKRKRNPQWLSTIFWKR